MSDAAGAELQQLAEELAKCIKCELSQSRERAIPGYGQSSADIMIVGAAVPHYSASHGRPFVGPAGDTVRKLLARKGRDYVLRSSSPAKLSPRRLGILC